MQCGCTLNHPKAALLKVITERRGATPGVWSAAAATTRPDTTRGGGTNNLHQCTKQQILLEPNLTHTEIFGIVHVLLKKITTTKLKRTLKQ